MNALLVDRDRIVKLLGLCSSVHDAEAAAAARKADQLLWRAGLTWGDVIAPGSTIDTDDDIIRACLSSAHALNDWELNFARSLRTQSYPVTPRQRATLQQIAAKVRQRRAA